jgi:hypothetical protein
MVWNLARKVQFPGNLVVFFNYIKEKARDNDLCLYWTPDCINHAST